VYFDEHLLALRNGPEDEFDPDGEVEVWGGDEKRLLTRSCAVFVPAGVPQSIGDPPRRSALHGDHYEERLHLQLRVRRWDARGAAT
jgi:hypothetical protein